MQPMAANPETSGEILHTNSPKEMAVAVPDYLAPSIGLETPNVVIERPADHDNEPAIKESGWVIVALGRSVPDDQVFENGKLVLGERVAYLQRADEIYNPDAEVETVLVDNLLRWQPQNRTAETDDRRYDLTRADGGTISAAEPTVAEQTQKETPTVLEAETSEAPEVPEVQEAIETPVAAAVIEVVNAVKQAEDPEKTVARLIGQNEVMANTVLEAVPALAKAGVDVDAVIQLLMAAKHEDAVLARLKEWRAARVDVDTARIATSLIAQKQLAGLSSSARIHLMDDLLADGEANDAGLVLNNLDIFTHSGHDIVAVQVLAQRGYQGWVSRQYPAMQQLRAA